MIPAIILNNTLETSASGKAYHLRFKTGSGRTISVWLPVSQTKVESGFLWVAEWLMKAGKDGIPQMQARNYESLDGKLILPEIEMPVTMADSVAVGGAIHKGFFTVQSPLDAKHRTFRVKTSAKSGKTVIGILTGSNNLSDYTWFGYLVGTEVRFWKNPRYGYETFGVTMPIGNAEVLECVAAILNDANGAGLRFATEYKNCSRCGKVLTVPESIEIGMGPECSGLGYASKKK